MLAVLVALWVAPLPLEPRAHRLVAIFGAVIVAWLTEAIPVAATALAIGPVLVVAGVTDPASAFAPYADPLLFLFVGGFMLAAAMSRHGLDRRLARAVLALPFVRGVAWRTYVAIAVAATLCSMWISNTATCAIFAPILLGLPHLRAPREATQGTEDPATRPLLALAFVCTTAGLGTPVGTPPNLITMRFLEAAGVRLSFLDWMAIGIPAALLLSAAAIVLTIRAGGSMAPLAAPERAPWTRGELVTAVCFALAVIGWTGPSLAEAAGVPGARAVSAALPPGAVAVLACMPLFVIPDAPRAGHEGTSILPWDIAVKIDWGVILLFGGGIALGAQLEDTGLAAAASRAVVSATGPTDVWTLAALACIGTVILSEIASNTAAANILVPLVIALARELDLSPVVPALAVGLGASIGFMLPIATAPNAMIYATGRVPQRAMIRAGFVLDGICIALVLALLRAICPARGWV